MSAEDAVLQAALDYHSRGWWPIPVQHASKKPIGKAWPDQRLDEAGIRKAFARRCNVGVLLGQPSGDLVDIDLDVPEAAALARVLIPATARFGRPGKPGSHYLVFARGEVKTRKYAAGGIASLVELRSDGAQTVFPPSVYVSGEQIEWEDEQVPVEIEASELERLVTMIAVGAALALAWPASGQRHECALAVAGVLLKSGASEETTRTMMGAIAQIAGDDEVEDRVACVESTAARMQAGQTVSGWNKLKEMLEPSIVTSLRRWLRAAVPERDSSGLPVIAVTDRQMRSVSDDIVRVLHETNDPPRLLERGGQLVRIRKDENGQPFIELLDESRLLGIANRVVDFMTTSKQGQARAANAPHQVLRDILVRGDWPYPPLVGLTQCPVVRPDGGIVEAPGYDPASRLVYVAQDRLVMKAVSHEPHDDELAEAVQQIDDLLVDFPFDGPASRANMIALLLEPLLRPAIDGPVPLALIDATSFGTGKSLLCEILALLATGHPAAMTTAPGSEDEMRKRITAMLLAGAEFVFIDNIVGQLRSESLAAAITATSWKDRLLGRSEMLELPQRAMWVATGNNIQVRGDLPRRCFWIRLDAKTAKPWLRGDFRHPSLAAWVTFHRGELLHALLTLCRAWWAAGRPPGDIGTLGTFEEWTRITGGILQHAGIEDFLGNLGRMYEEVDAEADQWEAFLGAWRDTSSEPVTTAQLREALQNAPALKATIPDDVSMAFDGSPAGTTVRLSKVLTTRVGQRFGPDNLRLERAAGDRSKKLARWRVESDASAGGAGGPGIDELLF